MLSTGPKLPRRTREEELEDYKEDCINTVRTEKCADGWMGKQLVHCLWRRDEKRTDSFERKASESFLRRDFYAKEIMRASEELNRLKRRCGKSETLRFLGLDDVVLGRWVYICLGKRVHDQFILFPTPPPFLESGISFCPILALVAVSVQGISGLP